MLNDTVSTLLRKNDLSITVSRKKILQLFTNAAGALAHADIEKQAPDFDRVTIYRTLQTFVDKGIIHTIPTADSSIRYALCKDACTQGHHHDNHVHFMCDECGLTTCLEQVSIPNVSLPNGFLVKQTDVVVSGICNKCIE